MNQKAFPLVSLVTDFNHILEDQENEKWGKKRQEKEKVAWFLVHFSVERNYRGNQIYKLVFIHPLQEDER